MASFVAQRAVLQLGHHYCTASVGSIGCSRAGHDCLRVKLSLQHVQCSLGTHAALPPSPPQDKTTISNIPAKDSMLWAHAVITWAVTFAVYWWLWK